MLPSEQMRPQRARHWLRSLLSVLYPPQCVACKEIAEYAPGLCHEEILREGFCPSCRDQVFRLETILCRICGHPLTSDHIEQAPSPDTLCHNCQRQRPGFRKARAIFVYEGAIRTAIHRFKYDGQHHAGRVLCELFAAIAPTLALDWTRYQWAAPVPLHPKRLRQRGFQQAWLLLDALSLSDATQKQPHLLERTAPTETQARLQKHERFANLSEVIQVNAAHQASLRNTRILLVDDVLTTGATADACTHALLQAGAASVDVLTLSRAIY